MSVHTDRPCKIIMATLKALIPDPDERNIFWSHFSKCGCVIAGSAVVNAMGRDHTAWIPNDIDIWLPQPTLTTYVFISILLKNGYKKKHTTHFPPSYTRLRKYVKEMIHFESLERGNKISIQIIVLSEPDVKAAIRSFDIVATQHVFSIDYESEKQYECSVSDISQRRSATSDFNQHIIRISKIAYDLQSLPEWARTMGRIRKYVDRGFTLPMDETEKIIANLNEILNQVERPFDEKTTTLSQTIMYYFKSIGVAFEMKRGSNQITIVPCPNISSTAHCFDYITMENTSIANILKINVATKKEFVKTQNEKVLDDIGIIMFPPAEKASGTVFSFKNVQDNLQNPNSIFYECQGYRPILKTQFIKISLSTGNYYVNKATLTSFINIDMIQNNWVFKLKGTMQRLSATASQNAVDAWNGRGSIESAHHCQDGTDMSIQTLTMVSLH